MNTEFVDLDALPVRFNPPDGWRTPHPLFISLYQAAEFPPDWKPYPDAPAIPASWPWWEENGTSWYSFFRRGAPMPARSLGNWFSLAALGLFSLTVAPFAFQDWKAWIGGLIGLTLLILGVKGVIRTVKRHSVLPIDPYDSVRIWATQRREAYFADAYQKYRLTTKRDVSLERFTHERSASWWGETLADEEN
jgi:hypothetical protein